MQVPPTFEFGWLYPNQIFRASSLGIQGFGWQGSLKLDEYEGLFYASTPSTFIRHYTVIWIATSAGRLLGWRGFSAYGAEK